MSPSLVKALAAFLAYVATTVGLIILKSAWFAILLYHFGIILILLRPAMRGTLPTLTTGWNATMTIILSAASVACGVVLVILWPLISLPNIDLDAKLAYFGLQGSVFYLFLFYYAITTPFLEELFWRGYLLEEKKRPGLTDILFGGYHLIVLVHFVKVPWALFSFLALIMLAWIWRQIVAKHGGLIVPVITHMVAGLSLMAAVFYLSR